MHLARRVLDLWRVAAAERERLLGPTDETASRPEVLERATLLLRMHAALRLLFPEDAELRAEWVRIRNRALGGRRPLELMNAEGVDALRRCADLLDAQAQQ